MQTISVFELNKALQTNREFQFLDVREQYEAEICSVAGFIHIPMHEICTRVVELNPVQKTVVMCKSGKRASAVANLLLTQFGFKEVCVVEGGIQAYITEIDTSLELYE